MRMRISGSALMERGPDRWFGLAMFVTLAMALVGGCTGMNRPPSVAPPPLSSSPERRATAQQQHAAPPKPKKLPAQPHETRAVEVDPADKTPPLDPQSLLGLDPESVQKRLGAPSRMENSALSREWVYAAPGCSFSVFFYPTLNSTSFHALKYSGARDNGERIDSSNACVRRILTARNNDN